MEDENPDLQKKYREIGAPLVYLKKKESELNSAPEIFNFAGSDSGPFSCFIWLRLDIGSSDSENPVVRILWSYPAAPSSVLSDFPNLGKFVFPDRTSLDTSLDLTYTFVLTNGSGIRTYGHGTTFTNGEAVVSLSPYPWCKFFSRLAFLFRVNGEFGRKLVRTLHNCPTPPSGAPFLVPLDLGISFTRPYDRLCSFVDTSPESVLEAFEVDDLLRILADLLLEKHIVVVGPSFSIVSTMIMSLLALVAPFDWMHILIPILPSSLINVLAAPPPYLIGILSSQLPLIQDIPIENAVMVHLNKYGKCEKVVYIRETEDDLPYSGTFSALGIGLRILKLRLSMEHTARDLCSLFLTYYATLFGNIITRGAKAYLNQEALSGKDLDFFRRLLSTQSFAVLNEEIGKSMRADNLDWLDNEFIVAMVRAHRTVFTEHYSILVREEEQGGGYIERYNECFGSSEDFTSWTAAVHGFGGHSVGVFRLVSHCLCSRWSSCFRDDDQEERMRSARFRQSCDAATQYHLSVNAQQENQQRRDGSTTSFAVIFGSPISSTPQTPAFSR